MRFRTIPGNVFPSVQASWFRRFSIRFVLNPLFAPEIGWVEALYECPYGRIVSNWKIEGDEFEWEVEIPPNTEAKVHVSGEVKARTLGSGTYDLKSNAAG